MINIEEERKAFEIEWIKLGGDFKSFSIIDNMYVPIPSVASAGNVIKELAERAVNSAFALWLIQSRQKQVVIDDLNIQLKDAKATPEGFVLVPKEPTPKMIDATWNFDEKIQDMSHNSRNEFIYNTMIAAAQEPAKAQSAPDVQQALNDRLLVRSIKEQVESHIAEISVNDLFDKGWLAAMRCIQNNIDMLEAQEPAND